MDANATRKPLGPRAGAWEWAFVFASGFITLIVEIIGAKLQGPFFGNSHFVLTNQILVTLLALSAGAWLGGRLADRGRGRAWIPALFLIAAVWLCLLFPVLEKANYFFLRFHVGPGAIMASVFFYLAPLAALGAAPPIVASLLAESHREAGRVAGRVFGIATLGGVAGCGVAGGILIPTLVNEASLLVAALLTLVFGALAAWRASTSPRAIAGTLALSTLAALVGIVGCQRQLRPRSGLGVEIARHASGHSLLLVMEDRATGQRYLVDDFVLQNCYETRSATSCASFTHALRALSEAYAGIPERALCVGLGIGVAPMELAASGSKVDAVEIHPGIPRLAASHFGFAPGAVKVELADGRGVLHDRSAEYDLVILDAFSGDSSPSHLLTREAFIDVQKALRPGGVLLLNCIASMKPEQDAFVRAVKSTLETVFQASCLHVSPGGNLFFVASDSDLQPDFDRALQGVDETFRERVGKTFEDRRRSLPRAGLVMTDDFNPIEFHDATFRAAERERLAWLMYRK